MAGELFVFEAENIKALSAEVKERYGPKQTRPTIQSIFDGVVPFL